MKYAIKITTYAPNTTAEAVISAALGFHNTLPHATVVDLFAPTGFHKGGIFTSKRRASMVAERINGRGMFGGFGQYCTLAEVVAA